MTVLPTEVEMSVMNMHRKILESKYIIKNGGVSVARNKALDKISGDYVTFIDSDDWVEPSYLLRFMEFPYADDQIVFQGYFMDYVGAVAKESTKEIPKQGRILHLGAILGKMFATPIIKLHNIRFDERLRLHEDHVFYYECLKYARQFDFPHMRVITTCIMENNPFLEDYSQLMPIFLHQNYYWTITNMTSQFQITNINASVFKNLV